MESQPQYPEFRGNLENSTLYMAYPTKAILPWYEWTDRSKELLLAFCSVLHSPYLRCIMTTFRNKIVLTC